MTKPAKIYQSGAAARFIDQKLEQGFVAFSLAELVSETGLSVVAARNQLLRLGNKVTRVASRQQFFLIVRPDHRSFGAPPVEWWLDDYFRWLGRPYYVALLSAAAAYGSSPQAIQETQVMTDLPRRTLHIGRVRVRFFMKSGIARAIVQDRPRAYAPLLISTPEQTVFDLVRYARRIGGVERAAETITPMLGMISAKRLPQVLIAEADTANALRLESLLKVVGADNLIRSVSGNSLSGAACRNL